MAGLGRAETFCGNLPGAKPAAAGVLGCQEGPQPGMVREEAVGLLEIFGAQGGLQRNTGHPGLESRFDARRRVLDD